MASLRDVLSKLQDDDPKAVKDLADLPEVRGQRVAPPPPLRYTFKLPAALGDESWDIFEYSEEGDIDSSTGKPRVKQAVTVIFDGDAALIIANAPALAKDWLGLPFSTRINTRPRGRGKDRIPVSDMEYLLAALGETQVAGNKDAVAKVQKHLSQEFDADIEYSSNCRKDKPIYFPDGKGGTVLMDGTNGMEAKLGCGKRYYHSQLPKDPTTGYAATEFQCSCGAMLLSFANLTRFGATKK